MIDALTNLLQQLRDAEELGNTVMDFDDETIEVSREWWAATIAVVQNAIALLDPPQTATKLPQTETETEKFEDLVERVVRENSEPTTKEATT